MKVESFLTALQTAMPSRETLEEYGLDDEEIADTQSTFVAMPRSNQRRTPLLPNNELARLVSDFDCSRVVIGQIMFADQLESTPQGVMFAHCEADFLVLRPDGAIAMVDHSAMESPYIECAIDAESFLDALALFINVVRDRASWVGRREEAVELCTNAAGGPKYREFFQLLCGSVGT